jgi:hypothetical protein
VDLELTRVQLDPDVTIGRLTIVGDDWGCWVCEDVQRPVGAPKVYGKTAIPIGRYRVVVTMSNRFKKPLPLLVDVPGFDGIRIHPGNVATDTDGCLLPGLDRLPKGVGRSVAAWTVLKEKIVHAIDSGDTVYITIHD